MPTETRDAEGPGPTAPTRLLRERLDGCPLCGSRTTTMWRENCRDWQQPNALDRFEYEACDRCGAFFLAERPLESELAKVYFPGYAPYVSTPSGAATNTRGPHLAARIAAMPLQAAGALLGAPRRRRLARMLAWAYKPESEEELVLDYGCGAPTFLDDARERGFATVGVDFTEDVLEEVRAHGHAAYLIGEELDRGVRDRSVGAVRMNHVVEHLYQPRTALTAIRRKLRPGGRIHLSTPDPGSIGSRLFRRRWHALDCPRHVVLYRPRVLCRLLAEHGFRDISVVHEAGPKDLTRSWGIVLYERGRIQHEQIAAMANDPIRSALLSPVASLAALISAADRYHVFARSSE